MNYIPLVGWLSGHRFGWIMLVSIGGGEGCLRDTSIGNGASVQFGVSMPIQETNWHSPVDTPLTVNSPPFFVVRPVVYSAWLLYYCNG